MERLSTRQFNRLRAASTIGIKRMDTVESASQLKGGVMEQQRLFDPAEDERERLNARRIVNLPRIPGQLNQAERQLLSALRLAAYEMRSLMGAEIRTGSAWRVERRRAG